ncbi:5-hydroxytryptamine receptor 3A-like [Anoplopoma fimbria]|uniref:5-hydroxytryptamine receptor 3A-like n=1 Tax=Anoplopoma fimbria TaxID=229290 RepID=UPI0023EBA696|nr:5-hydroxytryptamine receptor 3A-like [Anoplopoma fimbria]
MSALRTLAILALIGVCSCQTSDCSYLGVLTHLNLTTTNNVLSIMRPVKNWTTATLVQMDMLLYGILQVDEKFQTITSHIWIQMRWTNEFLTWNPSAFCGINSMTIPRSRLWIPDVNIHEDASDTGTIQNSPVVTLSFKGVVLVNTRQRLTSTCLLNLILFPFDTQLCNFTFTSMNSGADTIKLGTVYNDTQLTEVSEQIMVTRGEWQLVSLEILEYSVARESGSRSKLVYTVKIARKPMLYVIIFIVPLFYFLLLDLASFFINEARGEKLSFKVTILLSISVLLLILKDMLPSTEDSLPMIAMYCIGIFALVGLSVLEAMLVGFLFDLDGCSCKNGQTADDAQVDIQLEVNYHKGTDGAEETPEKSSLPPYRPDDCDLLELILKEVKTARQEVGAPRDKDQGRPGRYRRLAEIIDSVFFVLYFLTVLFFMTYMNVKWIVQIC